jgi:hypothetical protein
LTGKGSLIELASIARSVEAGCPGVVPPPQKQRYSLQLPVKQPYMRPDLPAICAACVVRRANDFPGYLCYFYAVFASYDLFLLQIFAITSLKQ